MVEDGSPGWRALRAAAVIAVALVVLRSVRRDGGDGPSGWALVLIGAVATAAGVGIALPHLTKEGLAIGTVAGSVVLVGGIAMCAFGLVNLLRGRRWPARALIVVSSVVVLALGLFVVGQAVAATNVPRTAVGATTPAQLGMEFSEVRMETTDGASVAAWYVPSRNGAAVVVRHGAGSTRSATLRHAEVLARHGYGVLMMDARGHGRSGGRAMDFGWHGDADVAAGVTYLLDRDEVVDGAVAVLGLSMGGEEALGAAAADERIAAVVGEGVGQRQAEDTRWLADEFGLRGAVQFQVERVMYGLTDLLTDAGPPTALAEAVERTAPRPVLLIAGGRTTDEPEIARRLEARSESVERWVVADAGHIRALATAPDEWEQRVIGFLDRALLDG